MNVVPPFTSLVSVSRPVVSQRFVMLGPAEVVGTVNFATSREA